jgi:hypothetical protein
MKGVLKFVGVLLLLILAYILIGGLFMEKKYELEKSIAIKASKEVVWQNISQFSNFAKWSPWSELDPNMTTQISGNDGNVGAKYSWEGNKDVGKGSMTYKSLHPQDDVQIGLQFLEPMESNADVIIKINDASDGTQTVTWAFETEFPYPFNALVPFMGMDKSLGADFERGLKYLKQLSESGTPAAPNIP